MLLKSTLQIFLAQTVQRPEGMGALDGQCRLLEMTEESRRTFGGSCRVWLIERTRSIVELDGSHNSYLDSR